jgi:hypothetical protein
LHFFERFLSIAFEQSDFVNVRSNVEFISNNKSEVPSGISGVNERLVVPPVDVFKPESVVVVVASAVLGIDENADENRRICFIGDCNCAMAGFERDRFRQRHGSNAAVE